MSYLDSRCWLRQAELFVWSGKWHDRRGGNRKHNRLPDRLIPKAWPDPGAVPASNQKEITRRGSFVCSAYILLLTNIVNLSVQVYIRLDFFIKFCPSNIRGRLYPVIDMLRVSVCKKWESAVHNNVIPLLGDTLCSPSSLVDLLQLKLQPQLRLFFWGIVWIKVAMTASQTESKGCKVTNTELFLQFLKVQYSQSLNVISVKVIEVFLTACVFAFN